MSLEERTPVVETAKCCVAMSETAVIVTETDWSQVTGRGGLNAFEKNTTISDITGVATEVLFVSCKVRIMRKQKILVKDWYLHLPTSSFTEKTLHLHRKVYIDMV